VKCSNSSNHQRTASVIPGPTYIRDVGYRCYVIGFRVNGQQKQCS